MTHDGVVEAIYEAVAEPEAYAGLAETLARSLGGSSGWIHEHDAHGGVRIETVHNLSPEIVEPYEAYYQHTDLWMQAVPRIAPDSAVLGERFVPAAVLNASEFYNDLLRRKGDIFHLNAAIIPDGDRVTVVAFQRTRGAGGFSEDQEAALQRLMPHLKRLSLTRWRLADARERLRQVEATVDRLSDAIVLCDEQARVRHLNRAAASCTELGGPLRVRDGRLCGATAIDHAALRAAVRDAAQRGVSTRLCLAVDEACQVVVDRLPARFGAPPTVCVTLRDVREKARRQADLGQQHFALTPAEGLLLASLLRGATLEAHAEARGASLHTVRSQLKSVLGKTETSRQAELVAKLLHMPD